MTFPYDQARLQALFSEVDSRVDDLGKVATAASQVQRRSRGLSEQDLREIERFAKSPGAPKELKDLQRRVDAGETTFTSSRELATALRRAEAAHGEHEERTGQRDTDWPRWYAEYMVGEQAGKQLPS